MHPIDKIIKFWFGRVEETIVPSERRARIWFGDSPDVDKVIREAFSEDLEKAIQGDYAEWEQEPRGQLALILLLDQFSRHIYRDTVRAYSQDNYALSICVQGIEKESDRALSLIERVFYYFPLLHSEHIAMQEQSLGVYQELTELALVETQIIYDSFFKFANHHYTIVERFDRFPQRNAVLRRDSTPAEIEYLKEAELL